MNGIDHQVKMENENMWEVKRIMRKAKHFFRLDNITMWKRKNGGSRIDFIYTNVFDGFIYDNLDIYLTNVKH